MPAGRPSDYSPEVGTNLCGLLAQGISLRTICMADDMPACSTVFGWLGKHKEFLEQYTRAREAGMEALAEEILEIADDSSQDAVTDEKGNIRENREFVNRARLKVDTRKWLMSKLAPKKYGEKLAVDHSGEVQHHVTVDV